MVQQILADPSTKGSNLMQRLRSIKRPPMTVVTHALHAACRTGDTAIVESLFRALPERDLRQVVNRPLGSKDYVPLNNAVYYGSVSVVKILLANGANPNYTNTHGESIDDTLRAGEEDMIAKLPSERIFIAETYRQSRQYLEERRKWLARVGTGPRHINVRPRVPRRVQAARTIEAWWLKRRPPPLPPDPDGPWRRAPARAGARRETGGQ